MNWEAIGALGEIVGAIAVVASLVYLATQIRIQNRESKISSVHEITEAFRNSIIALQDSEKSEIWIRGISDFDDLEPPEKFSLLQ